MGDDKRRLRLWGPNRPTLLEAIVTQSIAHAAETLVVLNDREAWPDLPARCIPDTITGAGPLAAIAAGLAVAQQPLCLVRACDMPSVDPALIDLLLSHANDYDAVVPVRPGGASRNRLAAEPLLACYQRRALPTIEQALAQGERQVIAALANLEVCYLSLNEWQAVDPTGRSFTNLNTPSDRQEFRETPP